MFNNSSVMELRKRMCGLESRIYSLEIREAKWNSAAKVIEQLVSASGYKVEYALPTAGGPVLVKVEGGQNG